LITVRAIWALAIVLPWIAAFIMHPGGWDLSATTVAALAIGNGVVTVVAGGLTSLDGRPWRRLPLLAGAVDIVLTLVFHVATNPTGPNLDPQGAPLGYAVEFVIILVAAVILLVVGILFGLTVRFGLRATSACSHIDR
jgi:hypothetical protein